MTIETLDDIVSELADSIGIYGGCKQDGPTVHCEECTCRPGWESAIKERIVSAVDVERRLDAMLAASPEPVAPATERCPECGMLDGHAEGCPEYWIDPTTNIGRPSIMQQHAQQVIADLRAEVEWLRGALDKLKTDPGAVFTNLSRGFIAKPLFRSMVFLYAEDESFDFASASQDIIDAARLREGGA